MPTRTDRLPSEMPSPSRASLPLQAYRCAASQTGNIRHPSQEVKESVRHAVESAVTVVRASQRAGGRTSRSWRPSGTVGTGRSLLPLRPDLALGARVPLRSSRTVNSWCPDNPRSTRCSGLAYPLRPCGTDCPKQAVGPRRSRQPPLAGQVLSDTDDLPGGAPDSPGVGLYVFASGVRCTLRLLSRRLLRVGPRPQDDPQGDHCRQD